jgi:hypothetical protein
VTVSGCLWLWSGLAEAERLRLSCTRACSAANVRELSTVVDLIDAALSGSCLERRGVEYAAGMPDLVECVADMPGATLPRLASACSGQAGAATFGGKAEAKERCDRCGLGEGCGWDTQKAALFGVAG